MTEKEKKELSKKEKKAILEDIQSEISDGKEGNEKKSKKTEKKSSKTRKRRTRRRRSKKGARRRIPAVALFATVFILFIVLVVLLIFVMSVGGPNNAVLSFFGQNEASLRTFLQGLVNNSMGSLSVILLAVLGGSLFYGFTRGKKERAKRATSFLFSIVSFGLLMLTIVSWLGLFTYVGSLQVAAELDEDDIVLILPDGRQLTPPISAESTQELAAPIDLTLSVAQIASTLNARGQEVLNVAWDFDNDGNSDVIEDNFDFIRRFSTPGRTTVVANINIRGTVEPLRKEITFMIPQGRIIAEPESGEVPLEVAFDASNLQVGDTLERFEWDLDGDLVFETITSGPRLVTTFEQIGTYRVRLNIIDSNNQVFPYETVVQVLPDQEEEIRGEISTNPEPDRDGVLRVNPQERVQLNAREISSLEGLITDYTWDFGDGTLQQQGNIVTHRFQQAGEYLITLDLQDEIGNRGNKSIPVEVQADASSPRAVISSAGGEDTSQVLEVNIPYTLNLSANQSQDGDAAIVKYEWDINGDGVSDAEGSEQSFTIREAGTQEITLIVTDTANLTNRATLSLLASSPPVIADFSIDPQSSLLPCDVQFDASASRCTLDDCSIIGYEWDFGDESDVQIGGAIITPHRYQEVGVYDASLKVYTDKGVEATFSQQVVCRLPQLNACFQPSREEGRSPLTLDLDPSCSTGTIEKFSWDMGDGTRSERVNPRHTYDRPGVYTIQLTITDDRQNIDTVSETVTAF